VVYALLKSIITLTGLVICGGVFIFRLQRGLFTHLRRARPTPTLNHWPRRLQGLLVYAFGGQRIFQLPLVGIAHFLIFWAFVSLLLAILAATMEGLLAFACPPVCPPILTFPGWLLFLQDVLTLGALLGVLYALWIRLWIKPARYQGSQGGIGLQILIYIVVILISLLVMNGLDILNSRSPGEIEQPFATLTGRLFTGLAPPVRGVLREVAFWLHLGTLLLFLAELPRGKHLHILTAFPTVFLRNLEPAGRLPEAYVADGKFGANAVEHLDRKQILDFYTCTECGRCQEVCPAYLSGAPLSPKRIIMEIRTGLENLQMAGGLIHEGTIWACMTCYACEAACPLFIDHIPLLVDLRRRLVEEGGIDEPLQRAFENLDTYGNAFGLPSAERTLWAQPVKPAIPDARRQEVEYLWLVGDTAAFDSNLMPLTRTAAQVFQRLGLDFGVLYEGEHNAGNDVRRSGEEGLFQELRRRNREALDQIHFRTILTTDPHTYNTLRWEYGLPAGTRIVHYTELFDEMLNDGRLFFNRRLEEKVTYHDPCYLGRYNGIYQPPRRLLHALGCTLVEMVEHGQQAACCGAGGGRFWMSGSPGLQQTPAERRLQQAAALSGVSTLVTACPKDYVIFRDALSGSDLEGRLNVKDLIELIHQALG
jgi:Fe-S oxidoreductase